MCAEVLFHARVEDPIFAFHLRNEPRHTVFVASSDWRAERFGSFEAGETAHDPRALRRTGSRRTGTR